MLIYNENKKGERKFKKCFNFDMYSVMIELGSRDNRPGFYLRVLNCDIEFFYRS